MNELQKAMLPIIIFPIIILVFLIFMVIYSSKKDKFKNNSFRNKVLEKNLSFVNYDELEYIHQKNVEISDLSEVKKEQYINLIKTIIPHFLMILFILLTLGMVLASQFISKDNLERMTFCCIVMFIIGLSIIPEKKYTKYREKIVNNFISAIHPEINYNFNKYTYIAYKAKIMEFTLYSTHREKNIPESYRLAKELYVDACFEPISYKNWFEIANYIQCPLELFNFTDLANVKIQEKRKY